MRILKTRLTGLTKRFGALVSGTLAAFLLLLNFTSCEIGLGPAVDTQAPDISFSEDDATRIDSNAVIRDKFAITGDWADDGTIKEIKVTYKHNASKKSHTIDGEIFFNENTTESGTWRVVINPFEKDENNPDGLGLIDGTYDFKIVIRDKGNHKTEITRSFIIDNTAPVVALSRPSSDINSVQNEIENYGQNFTIEGQAADDNDINSLIINFYDKNDLSTPIATKIQNSIAATIDLDIAKWGDEVYDKLYIGQNYSGSEEDKAEWLKQYINEGSKDFVCTITAYDGAKRYPIEGERTAEDDLGNKQEQFIRYSDWEKLKAAYDEENGTNIKMPDLYHIKNGTYTISSTRNADEQDSVNQLWNELKTNSLIEKGLFSLNPMNNPTYSISGFSFNTENEVENERLLTIQLAKGLDGISLDTTNMKVFLTPLANQGDASTIDLDTVNKLYPKDSVFQKKGDGQFATKIVKEQFTDSNGNTASIDYGKLYIIGVEGADIKGNKIVASFENELYIMRFKAKEAAPKLNITPVESTLYLKKGEELTIKGTTSVPDGHPELSITCAKGSEDAQTVWSYTVTDADLDTAQSGGGLKIYNFEHTFKSGTGELFDVNNSDQYLLEITSSLDKYPTTYQRTVIYDVKGPEISIDSILPVAEKYTGDEDASKTPGEYLNGDITMKVAITDLDDKVYIQAPDPSKNEADRRPYFIITDENDVELEFKVGTETTASKKHFITTPTKQSFVIHTNDIVASTSSSSKVIKIKIYAQDTAGNLGVDINDKTKEFVREYIVDQTTDKPLILPYNANSLTLTYDTKAKIDEALSNKIYKSVLTTGSPLQLKLIDDDGIASYVFKISEKWTAGMGENPVLSIPEGYDKTLADVPTDYMFSYSLPTTSGTYKCSIDISDVNGNTSSKSFWIIVTGAAPIINDVQTDPSSKIITLSTGAKTSTAKTKFVNTISIDSGYDKFDVIRREYTSEDNYTDTYLYGGEGTGIPQLTGKTFTDEFIPSASRYANKVIYIVKDEMGHEGQKEFAYNIDSSAPSIDVATIGVPTNTQTASNSVRFTAEATDYSVAGEVSSNVSILEYTFDESKATENIKQVRGISQLNETVVFSEYEYAFGTAASPNEGVKVFYIRAIDDVGNIGNWVSKSFMYDKAAPSVNITKYKRGSEAEKEFVGNSEDKSFETGESFALSGTVSDGNGINTFEIWQKRVGHETSYQTNANENPVYGKKLGVTKAIVQADGSWTITGLPRDEDNLNSTAVESGTYVYTICATDNAAFNSEPAKTTEAAVTVQIDKTPPTVKIDLEKGDTHDSIAYGENSLKGSAYTFRGEVNDNPEVDGDHSSGFDKLYYMFTLTPTEPSFDLGKYVSSTTGTWSISMLLGTGTGTDTDETLYEGKRYLWVKGVDKAGNWSDAKYVGFMIDQANPSIPSSIVKKVIGSTETEVSADSTDGIVYLNEETQAEKYIISGTVSDANGPCTVFIDNEEVDVSSGAWSKEFSKQGSYNHKITVYDASGKTGIANKSFEKTVSVIFDTVKPVATITGFDISPTAAEKKWVSGTGSIYISGTAKDPLYNNEEGTASDLKELYITKADGTYKSISVAKTWNEQYEIPVNFEENDDDTSHSITVKVVDAAKNAEEYTYYFRYDKTPPKARLSLNKNGQFVKESDFASIELSGYAHDGRAAASGSEPAKGRVVKTAQITVRKDDNITPVHTIDLIDLDLLNPDKGDSFGNFTTGLSASDYTEDGTYVFTLDVKDVAGNDTEAGSTLTASMTVDTTPPDISKVCFGEISSNTTVLNSKAAKSIISVKFDEANPEAVYYYIDSSVSADSAYTNGKAEAVQDADWINMTYTSNGNTRTASKDGSFEDGDGRVYIKVVDKAGNVTYNTSLTYKVDTTKPDVSLDKVDGSLLTGTKLVNGTQDVVFTVKASDRNDNTGATAVEQDFTKIASVNLSKIKTTSITAAGDEIGSQTDAANGIWTITIPSSRFSSFESDTYPVYVTVKDTIGNEKEVEMFSLDIDKDKPQIKSYTLDDSYDTQTTEDGARVYYMNNKKKALNLFVVAYDKRGIDEVTLKLKNGETVLKTISLNEATVTFSSSDWASTWQSWTDDITAELSVKDKAKNVVETPTKFKIKFDTEAPAALHVVDDKNKDLVVRIGEAKNDAGEAGSTDPLDSDVGGKYSHDTYGSALSMKIRGYYPDNEGGSGINKFYYMTFNKKEVLIDENITGTAPVTTDTTISFKDLQALTAYVIANYNSNGGTFLAIPEESRNVEFNKNIGTSTNPSYQKEIRVIKSNYKNEFKGFEEGKNYLVIVAEDNVGNTSVDYAEVPSPQDPSVMGIYPCYSLNVDLRSPTIKGTQQTGTEYTNVISTDNTPVNISGTVADEPNKKDGVYIANGSSGIKEIVFTSNQNNENVKLTGESLHLTADEIALNPSPKAWTANIKSLLSSEGLAIITATVTDNAGFQTSAKVANITVDKTSPTVEINSPKSNAKTSNEITINGSVFDGGSGVNTTTGITLYYTKSSTAGAKKPGTDDTSAIGDDAESEWVAYGTKMTLSGQSWNGSFTVPDEIAAENADTPVYISVGAVDNAGTTGNSGYSNPVAVVVDRVKPVFVDSSSGVDGKYGQTAVNNAWSKATTLNIFGQFTDFGGSGVTTVYYKLGAAAEESLPTTDGSYNTNVKNFAIGENTLKVWAEDAAGNKSDTVEYTVQVDTTPPTIVSGHTKSVYYNGSGACTITVTASDTASGIKNVVISRDGTNDKVTINPPASGNTYSANIASFFSSVNSGTFAITATATDMAGNEKFIAASVVIDKTPPTLRITTPAESEKTKETFNLGGTADDGTGAGIDTSSGKGLTLYYTTSSSVKANLPTTATIGTTADSKWVAYETKPNLTGQDWTCSFDASEIADEDDVTPIYFTVGAVDTSGTGNAGYSTVRTIVVDREKPAKTQFKVDETAENSVNTTWFKNRTVNINGTFDDGDGSGVVSVKYKVKKGDAAYGSEQTLASDGSFSKNIELENGTNKITVWAVDAVNNSSDSVEYTVQVDTAFPEISELDDENPVFGNITLTNGKQAKDFEFYVTDNGSGIDTTASAVHSVQAGSRTITNGANGSSFTVTAVSGVTNKWKVKITIGANDLKELSGTNSVLVIVKDKADNKSNPKSVGMINVDKDKPVPSFTSHQANETVNKTITLKGAVTDPSNSAITAVALTANGTTVSPVTYSNGQWTATLDTTTLYNATATQALNLSLTATDEAGNTSDAKTLALTIDQKADRPVITVSQFKQNEDTTLRMKNVYGSISDDDGNIKKLWYWATTQHKSEDTNPTGVPTEAPTATDDKDWTDITEEISGGSWSTESTESDGETTWYFAVQDQNDSIFCTISSSELERPYIKYSDSSKLDNTTGVSFKYDTNPPTVNSLDLYRAATGTTTTAEEISTNANIAWSNVSGMAFGGNYDVLYAKVVVEEGTGMMALEGTAGSAPTKSPVAISYVNKDGVSLNYEHIKAVSSDNGTYTYYLGPLVMNTTEAHDFKVTVQDAVTNKGYITRSIKVDNTAPKDISNVKPAKTDTQNGVVNFRGVMSDNADGSGIRFEKDANGVIIDNNYGVEWYIPIDTQNADNIKTLDEANSIVWRKPTTKGSSSWEIEFENLGTTMDYNSSTYKVSTDYDGYETVSGSGLYDIPVWFRLTDEVGNVGYNTENSIRYDPNADRPSVQITYPAHEAGKQYVQMGGTITISGMANDDDGISAVYLQFDMDGDGEFENGVNIPGCPYATSGNDSVLDTIPDGSSQKGILAHGTKSWYYTINVSQLQGLKYDPDNNPKTLNVRAIAIEKDTDKAENDYLYSAWSDTLHISVNNDIPNYSNIKLKRFSEVPTSANLATKPADAEQDYTPDMYIKGSETDWYFTGWVEVSGDVTVASITSTAEGIITASADSGKKMYFAIPISANSTNGNAWVTNLRAEDNTNPPNANPYNGITVNIDSQAPEFPDTKTVNNKTEIKLYKGDYGKTDLSTANKVQDSNSWFAFAGKITEGGSGFSRLAFYYERKGAGSDTTDRVYNPMEGHGVDNRVNRADIVSSAQNGEVYINSEKLPALYITGATRSEENSITAEIFKENANVRVGGLIKIGGIYRKIESIDDRDTDGKITFTPSCSTSYKIAEVIYAMVVDNTGESREGNTIKLDDGDGMVESYQKSGSNYIWDATISSKNIPDGPIEIHCVAFDVAGNSAHGYTTTSVSNNPPRITKVMFGTDLNSDTYYNLDTEFQSWYALEGNDTTKGTDKWDLEAKIGTKYFKAKKDLVVIPEFVGGSGTIYYMYSKGATGITEAETGTLADNEANPPVAATIAALAASDANIVTNAAPTTQATLTATADTDNKIGVIVLVNGANDGLGTISTSEGEDGTNVYRFSFWDSTESCTPGSTSQWTVLNATFAQDLVDNTPPTGFITPFYWRSKDDASVIYTGGVAQGHIELEGDLPAETFTAGATDKEMDRDPKVSGKIKIEGTAFDETMLKTVKLTFDTKSVTATYNPKSNPKWSYATNGADFTLDVDDDKGPTQDGHSVTWTYTIDSSKASAITGTERVIKVEVNDASSENDGAGNSNTPGTTSTSTATPTGYYKVDVVPYITGVFRNVTYNTNRTSSGATPLLRGEEVNTVEGFNLGIPDGFTLGITLNTKADGTGTSYDMTSPTVVTSGSKLSFTMLSTAKDGYLTVALSKTTGGNTTTIKSLNNLNDDSLAYNKENTLNVSSTDNWTDTRYVRVWQSNTGDYFAGSTLPIYPSMAMGTGGTLYASFSNYSASSVYYSTIGGTAQQVFYGYDPPEETDICVSGTGTVNVVYNANYHGGTEDSWAADSDSCGGLYMYDYNAASVWVGRDRRKVLRFELFYHNKMLQQFKNMRVKRADSSDSGIVHVAYYDRTKNSIHYSEVASNYSYTTYNSRQNQNGYNVTVATSDNEISWVNIDGGYDTDDNKYHKDSSNLRYNDQIKSIYLDDIDEDGTDNDYTCFEDTKRCSGTGESLGLALTKYTPADQPNQTKYYPVIVYYDAENMILKLARATDDTPKGNIKEWKVQDVLSSSDINYKTMVDYIACDIDSDGYLHIVFQNTKGQLCYVKSTNTSANGATKYTFGQSVIVADSATNIDLTLHGTTPYISYLTRINSYDGMNIAFWDSTLDLNCDGTAEGGWETMTAPLNYKVSNCKSCIEAHPNPSNNGVDWEAAVGFTPGDLYRVAYYVGNGSGH